MACGPHPLLSFPSHSRAQGRDVACHRSGSGSWRPVGAFAQSATSRRRPPTSTCWSRSRQEATQTPRRCSPTSRRASLGSSPATWTWRSGRAPLRHAAPRQGRVARRARLLLSRDPTRASAVWPGWPGPSSGGSSACAPSNSLHTPSEPRVGPRTSGARRGPRWHGSCATTSAACRRTSVRRPVLQPRAQHRECVEQALRDRDPRRDPGGPVPRRLPHAASRRHAGGTPLYGYRFRVLLHPNPHKARQGSKQKTESPDPRRRTGRWGRSSVWEILRNPKYTGYQVWNRRARKRGGKANPPEEWIWSEEPAHEPLVSQRCSRKRPAAPSPGTTS